jgi:hypothetical protein
MKKLGRGAIAAAGTTVYTVPSGYRTEVLDINIANTTATETTCSIHLVPSGSSATADNMLFPAVAIKGNHLIQWTGIELLNAGDSIRGVAGVDSAITVNITGNEYRASA